MRVLAGDVGGTHARLAVFEMHGDRPVAVRRRTFRSREYPGLAAIVREFLEEVGDRPEAACFGVACPVTDGSCRLPNLDWEMEASSFAREIGIEGTRLVNDFDAVGHGLECLGEEDVEELQRGEPRERAATALIGAGTGLGHGYLTWHGGRYHVHSSEGGHADFAPRSPLERELLGYLGDRFGRVSWERVLSGPGLVNLYDFLRESGRGTERPEVRREMDREDAARVISLHGLRGTDELCARALDLFVSAYGAQAGNLALAVKAEAGVYVAGGIAPAILEKLRAGAFMEAFRSKGRLSYLLERIPVRVIVNPDVGLLGAAAAAAYGDDDA